MRFLADESIDQPIVDRLRAEGHDVTAVIEFEPGLSNDAFWTPHEHGTPYC